MANGTDHRSATGPIADNSSVADRLACTRELAVRLLERWPGAMIVFDQAPRARQGWLYLPDLRRVRRRPGARRAMTIAYSA
ncbi:MAG: hypothetical protein ACRDZ4_05750 [Egibacteraceae bacterium]